MNNKKTEKFEFQSEVKQLLQILVYSLYEHKDVFLRELISNAVDALNKAKFHSLTNEEKDEKDPELTINIKTDKDKSTLTIEDTGIGMNRDDLINNLGTIAHSGTMEFLKKLSENNEKKNLDLIGKFGVGFYSAFMVAEKVRVVTKTADTEKAYEWISDGGSDYTINEVKKEKRGTLIELHLKEEEKEFLEPFRLKSIITTHSKFVPFDIFIDKEKAETYDAIWTQPKSSLKEDDYNSFYKSIDFMNQEPETYIHLSSDAPVQFNSILFIPKKSTEIAGFFKSEPGVDLYCRKVLIQKGSKDLIPEYLRFIKGVIDSEDLPLNISRETIQTNIIVEKIRKNVLKRIFRHLSEMKKKEREKFLSVWNNFSRNFKEGITVDFENKDAIAGLLMFNSSAVENGELTDLDSYIERMKEDQKEIYYITGSDIAAAKNNPAMEAFLSRDIEVLILNDPTDEIVIDHLRQYKEKTFKPAESSDINFDDEKNNGNSDDEKSAEGLVDYLKTIYSEKVEDVKISRRLQDSPCILVLPQNGPSMQMEKMMKMINKEYNFSKKTLEINPSHKLIKELTRIHKTNPASSELKNLSMQMLDNMIIREGVTEAIDNSIPRIQEIMYMAAKGIENTK